MLLKYLSLYSFCIDLRRTRMKRHITLRRKFAVQMLVLGIGSATALAYSGRAYAGNVNWAGPNNGEWDVAGNWSGGAIPGSADDVTDNLGNTSIVGDAAVQSSTPSNFSIDSLTNSGGGEILNEYSGSLAIAGDLNNSNNSLLMNSGDNDQGISSTGTTLNGSLYNNGATIESTDGAFFDMTGGGAAGSTTLTNENGGVIEAYGQNPILSGLGGTIDLGDISGYTNLGSLTNKTNSTIEALNGGGINVLSANISNDSTSTIEASGSGNGYGSVINFSTLQTQGVANVDDITNSGIVLASSQGSITQAGYGEGGTASFTNTSTGTLEVTDQNSFIDLSLTTALANSGNIKVLNYGVLDVYNDINQTAGITLVDNAGLGANDFNQTGGTTLVKDNGSLSLGEFNQTAGLTKVDNSTVYVNNFVLEGGTLDGTGGIIKGIVVQTGGTFNPGSDPSNFTISGNYTLSSGKLMIDIAGISSFDQLMVGGNTSLTGGTLSLDFINGFVPANGDTFDFLQTTGSLTGNFSSIESNLGGSYSFNNGILTVGGAPPPVPESSSSAALLLLIAPSALFAVRHGKGARV